MNVIQVIVIKMVNTNSKEFREKVQAHIRNFMKGMGGMTSLFHDIEYLMKRDRTSAYRAAYEYCLGGGFQIGQYNALQTLKRWGLTDEKRLWSYKDNRGDEGPEVLYWHLVSKEVSKMYEDWKEGKPLTKKPAKKKKILRRK